MPDLLKTKRNTRTGLKCHHSQCFDLNAYIRRSLASNNYLCPVCGKKLGFPELRIDTLFFERVTLQEKKPNSLFEQQQPDNRFQLYDLESQRFFADDDYYDEKYF
jgi:hypothetical protein